MELVTLKHSLADGTPLEATFSPSQGMNLLSYKRGAIEVIDQKTRPAFEERFAGLGPLIGPHFHRRKTVAIPKLPDESLFPHIARCKAKGILDPFSHGIARYAPWKFEAGPTQIRAKLSSKDQWNNVPLAAIEGQKFEMQMNASLSSYGLSIFLSVVSDADSLVGIHYYYRLPNGKGIVRSAVKPRYIAENELKQIPAEWDYDGLNLNFDLARSADYTFYPAPQPLRGEIWLETDEYRLRTNYDCICQENSWQLYHPEGASFVCIEPISAQDPRHPNLTVSSISIHLYIEPTNHG